MRIITENAEETQKLGMALAKLVTPGDTILLNGDLGAGKTTFTQGFARALGINRPLKSPTFTLVREYQTTNFPLYHLDVYRLGEEGGADELGLEEYFGRDGVAIIEWPEFIKAAWPNDFLTITIARTSSHSEAERVVTLDATGQQSQAILEKLETIWN